ncbi:hypothetical protein [Rosenbergiella collisarenosi]|uniref:hypothetical protein n=1 Tax=Rosenbergiella collisarenosi TaxID=1544695 RepID=UPI001F4E9E45|nr:hypothetical protein [Rosenbergiella collisarenosi]
MEVIEEYPDIAVYWDFEAMKTTLKSSEGLPLSGGELIMVDFFLSVWFGKTMNFDFHRAAGKLSGNNKSVIMDWFMNPYYP